MIDDIDLNKAAIILRKHLADFEAFLTELSL